MRHLSIPVSDRAQGTTADAWMRIGQILDGENLHGIIARRTLRGIFEIWGQYTHEGPIVPIDHKASLSSALRMLHAGLVTYGTASDVTAVALEEPRWMAFLETNAMLWHPEDTVLENRAATLMIPAAHTGAHRTLARIATAHDACRSNLLHRAVAMAHPFASITLTPHMPQR